MFSISIDESIDDRNYYRFVIFTYDSEVSKYFEDLYSITLLGKEIRHYNIETALYQADTTIFNNPEDLEGRRLILTFTDNTQR